MRKTIKKFLIYLFYPLAKRLGFIKSNQENNKNSIYDKNSLLHTFFNTLKAINFIPKHIVDVGANHGTWTREALIQFPECRFTLLEPQYWLKDSIHDLLENNSNISFNAMGVGKQSGTFKFTIADRDDSCSFIYSEEEAKKNGYNQIDVPIVTLNEFIIAQNLPVPDIIKIDAEGLDIDVLEGASDFFGKTEVFMVEAGVVNKSIPNNFLKLINFMDSIGYRFFEITDLNRPFLPAVLWLAELVFVKKEGIIDSYLLK